MCSSVFCDVFRTVGVRSQKTEKYPSSTSSFSHCMKIHHIGAWLKALVTSLGAPQKWSETETQLYVIEYLFLIVLESGIAHCMFFTQEEIYMKTAEENNGVIDSEMDE